MQPEVNRETGGLSLSPPVLLLDGSPPPMTAPDGIGRSTLVARSSSSLTTQLAPEKRRWRIEGEEEGHGGAREQERRRDANGLCLLVFLSICCCTSLSSFLSLSPSSPSFSPSLSYSLIESSAAGRPRRRRSLPPHLHASAPRDLCLGAALSGDGKRRRGGSGRGEELGEAAAVVGGEV